MCEFGSFNLLACQCFSDVQCKIYCGKTRRTDPVDGCTCISDAEYRAYFPDWATEKDIDYSWKIQFERFQVLANTFESQEIRPLKPMSEESGSKRLNIMDEIFGNDSGANLAAGSALAYALAILAFVFE